MTLNRQQKQPSPIKIVYRRGSKFVCGMCRIAYASQKDAKSCLRDDIERLVALQPVQVIKKGTSCTYRCSICSRDYAHHDSALACARDCKYELDKQRILEEKITGIPLKPPNPHKFPKRTTMTVQVQQIAKVSLKRQDDDSNRHSNLMPEKTQEALHIEELTGVENELNSTDAQPLEAQPEIKANVPPEENLKEKFYREDAKYVCSTCNEKYFTKVEVIECFDRHATEKQDEIA